MFHWFWYGVFWLGRLTGALGPLAFLAVLTHSVANPGALDRYFFHLPHYLPASAAKAPALPTKLSQAWHLGAIAAQLNASALTPDAARALAAAHLRLPDPSALNLTELLRLGENLAAHEAHRTPWAKLLGLWSFVNIMWALSILGITTTISPVLYILCGPLIARVFRTLRILLLYLHALLRPAYNLAAFHLAASALLSAPHYPPAVAPWVALTAAALALPTLSLSLAQLRIPLYYPSYPAPTSPTANPLPPHPPPPRYALPHHTYRALHTLLLNLFAAATFTLAALPHGSRLLAFLATAAFFGALGFSITPYCCGWAIGYHSDASLYTSMLSSTTLIALLLTATQAGPPLSTHAALFSPGVSIMGGCALGVAGLILTSAWGYRRHTVQWAAANAAFALVCVALLIGAAVAHVTPLRCTATVFLTLWLSQKTLEVLNGELVVVGVFVASLALWRLSFFLKAHPEYLLSLLDMFELATQ